MAAAANRSLEARLTHKVGPLPVWAWAASIIGLYLIYTRLHKGATTPVPVTKNTSGTDSGAQAPASGQGNPADNMNGDQLDLLLANQKSSYDSLLTALQTMSVGGASGFGPGYGTATPVAARSNNAPPSAASPFGVASAPAIAAPDPTAQGAPGTAAYIAATTGRPAVYATPEGPPLVGVDARMAHPSPATLATGARFATAQSETYAKQVTAAAQGYHTAGF